MKNKLKLSLCSKPESNRLTVVLSYSSLNTAEKDLKLRPRNKGNSNEIIEKNTSGKCLSMFTL